MHVIDPQTFGPAMAALIPPDRVMPLGPAAPNFEARHALKALTVDRAFEGRTVTDRAMAEACLAGLWLLHDFLEESHTISQSLPSTTGSYWHGIMHRREPDASNSAYWFRRVGRHPAFEPLAKHVWNLEDKLAEVEAVVRDGDWDPFAFIDLCEAARETSSPLQQQCQSIQMIEWDVLMDWCFRQAVAD